MEQITAPQQPIPVYILLREKLLALDLIGPAEVLRYANRVAEKGAGQRCLTCAISVRSLTSSLQLA